MRRGEHHAWNPAVQPPEVTCRTSGYLLSPALAELVALAWEEAARTASEDKRRLLAKVVAAALRGDSDALVDATEFLLRTVIALDPAHVALLVVIATPQVMQEARPGRRPARPSTGSR
jgi:hypothetical protein